MASTLSCFMAPRSCCFLPISRERSQSVKLLVRNAWIQMDSFFFFHSFYFPSPLTQHSRCASAHLRGADIVFPGHKKATNASFALMSDVFKRGLQCHPPWSSCEVAAHVCGAIYSVMKCGDLGRLRVHLPFYTLVHTLVWARVPPTSTVLWLYVTANTSIH